MNKKSKVINLENSLDKDATTQIKPANRMVIGDVGSGKTLVAMMSMLSYLQSAYTHTAEMKLDRKFIWSTAMMVPTEVLANQHYASLCQLKDALGLHWLDVVLVTNKQKIINQEKVGKKQFESYILEDSINTSSNLMRYSCWVGTQALLFQQNFQPDLIVTDEQHRFGVRQRQAMSVANEQLTAHFVSMTATPIPRTLALTVYGDLQVSFVQRINTRKPITTQILHIEKFESVVLPLIKKELESGKKIFVICPAIESAEEEGESGNEVMWTLDKAEKFILEFIPRANILKIHGRQKDKDKLLQQFRDDAEAQILISTTVVEVGVDVPKASTMLIFNPERFGLAQLHQIRGRVGRNDYDNNYCFMVIDQEDSQFIPRLRFLCYSQDGFEIAQEDLKLRGQGDLFGTQQSGSGNELLGLEIEEYGRIRQIVNSIDFESLEKDLPRLNEYLKQGANEVWRE